MAVDPHFVAELKARGLMYQHTDFAALEEHLKQPRTVYCGFDPTADSFHVGTLVPIFMLKRFQQAGHRPVVLLGGATGLIGDPSFKAAERKLNGAEVVKGWSAKLQKQFARFLNFEGGTSKATFADARLVNNFDWVSKMDVITFLRDVGKYFSVNAMISKEAVRSRLEREDVGISFTEFSYALLQGYDFAHLFKAEGCTLQIGGSDQWGNITAGVEYTRKAQGGHVHALTFPLVTKADGTKFGKTESGTVWLDAEKTSPYSFYQFWLNTPDSKVEEYLKYFSFKPLSALAELTKNHNAAPHKREGQKTLAEELTTLVHGREKLEQAQFITSVVFAPEGDGWQSLPAAAFAELSQDGLPTTHLREETPILAALSQTGLATSNRQAREFVDAGSVRINGTLVPPQSYQYALTPQQSFFGRYTVLQVGKKKTHLIVWS